MNANRDQLHNVIDGLPDIQLAAVLADVKRTAPRGPLTTVPFA